MKCFSVNKASVCAYFISAGFVRLFKFTRPESPPNNEPHSAKGIYPWGFPNKSNLWTTGWGLLPSSPVTVNDVIAMHVALCKSLKYALLSTDLRGNFLVGAVDVLYITLVLNTTCSHLPHNARHSFSGATFLFTCSQTCTSSTALSFRFFAVVSILQCAISSGWNRF